MKNILLTIILIFTLTGCLPENKDTNENNPPMIKLPTVNSGFKSLLEPLSERIWLSKYYGSLLDFPNFYSRNKFCKTWPKNIKEDKKKSLWSYKCTPVNVYVHDSNDKIKTINIQMLDIGNSDEILRDVLNIIRTNSLGYYKIDEIKKKEIRQKIIEEIEADIEITDNMLFYTYHRLEKYYFSEELNSDGINSGSKYIINRDKSNVSLLDLNLAQVDKTDDIVRYTFSLLRQDLRKIQK